MLKPHLLWTILVFAILGGLIVRFATQQDWSWSNSSTASTSTSTSTNGYNERADGNGNGYGNARSYRSDGQRNVAGQFDYYALVLSWSPTYCAEKGDNDRMQCNRSDGRRYSFVLHGLWPQYERGYPSDCELPRRPFVPQPVIDSMLDVMPSRGLVIHEYRAHGTCSGLDPAPYFSTARRLFDGIKIPERFRNPFQSQYVSPSDIRNEFLRANPGFERRHADRRLQWKRRAAEGSPFLLLERRQATRLWRKRKSAQALLRRPRLHSACALDCTGRNNPRPLSVIRS